MRPIDADDLLKQKPFTYTRQELNYYCEGFADCAQEARETISKTPTLTPPNEPRMINADKLAKRIAGHSNYHGDSILAAIYCAAEGKENDVPIRPIETPPNEPLTCEGCVYENNEHEECNYCRRAVYLSDYYYHLPEGDEDT